MPPFPPIEPPPTQWRLPRPTVGSGSDVVAVGADLEPGTILAAYRCGLFPMPFDDGESAVLAWWSPDPRAVIPLDGLRVSRSLRKSAGRFEIRVDTAFAEVVAGCAAPRRTGAWITADIARAYLRLHELGWAHSVEAWAGGRLAGGLYGIGIGRFFAGESMFHRETDASKVALMGLVARLARAGGLLLDVQWLTPHLASLGAVEIPRRRYLSLLGAALDGPPAQWR